MSRSAINNAFTSLVSAEAAFLAAEFVAPMVRGHGVTVRIGGERCSLLIVPADFQGWGVFRALSHKVALLAGPVSAARRQEYLSLFEAVRLVVCGRRGSRTVAVRAGGGDYSSQATGPIEVRLVEEAELFDTVLARFDGVQFWFDQIDRQSDLASAAYLRREVARKTDPEDLDLACLTAAQRRAYELAHGQESAIVQYDDLSIYSTGVCLPGADRQLGLNGLVEGYRDMPGSGGSARYDGIPSGYFW